MAFHRRNGRRAVEGSADVQAGDVQREHPEVVVVVDCSGEMIDVRPGDTETKAIVEMSMSSDIAHKFWFGKVNLTMALSRRQMIAKGPIPKILKLLPAIKPTYAMYPKYLEENGYQKYNIH